MRKARLNPMALPGFVAARGGVLTIAEQTYVVG